jgi:hypothetical protein
LLRVHDSLAVSTFRVTLLAGSNSQWTDAFPHEQQSAKPKGEQGEGTWFRRRRDEPGIIHGDIRKSERTSISPVSVHEYNKGLNAGINVRIVSRAIRSQTYGELTLPPVG